MKEETACETRVDNGIEQKKEKKWKKRMIAFATKYICLVCNFWFNSKILYLFKLSAAHFYLISFLPVYAPIIGFRFISENIVFKWLSTSCISILFVFFFYFLIIIILCWIQSKWNEMEWNSNLSRNINKYFFRFIRFLLFSFSIHQTKHKTKIQKKSSQKKNI